MAGKAGWVLAGAFLVAMSSTARAQVGIAVGNPYTGTSVVVGTPAYGYGGGYGPVYAPGAAYYNSGYAGYAPVGVVGRPYVSPGYGYYRPYPYGYRPYRRYYGRRW